MDSHAEDGDLASRALEGDQQAFERLCALAERTVRGHIRVRVRRDEDVQDLVQETWILVWQKLPTFDPARGKFVAFARYWADILVRRYWDSAAGRGIEITMSSAGESENDEDAPGDVMDRLAMRGTGPYPAPDDPVDATVYATLLEITFNTVSPPHQLIAFGFAKALDFKPRRVAADLSDTPLASLVNVLQRAYVEQSEIPRGRIAPAFEPLRARLEERFADAVHDSTTLATYPALHDRIVGETTLADYYTGEPTADITQWWYAVKRRVLAELQRRASGPLAELLRQSQQRPARKGALGRIGG